MLELLAYTVLLLGVMPALLYGIGKLIVTYNAKLSLAGRAAAPNVAAPAPRYEGPRYEGLHERLTTAAKANPFLPWSKRRAD